MSRHLEEQSLEKAFYQLADRLIDSLHHGEHLTINLVNSPDLTMLKSDSQEWSLMGM